MTSETLLYKLQYTKAYRETRLEVAHWVLDRPEIFPELLDFCFQVDDEISYRAAWILEFVCLEDITLLYPHFEKFFGNLSKIKFEQALRPFSKICWLLTERFYKNKDTSLLSLFRSEYRETLVESAFDWLITDKKVATQAFAIKSLFLLGTEYDWIHPELKTILERNMPTGSAGYKSIGTKKVASINKRKG
ncbi:MAG: adenylosuccinate lyase [Patiriisocius sp.]|uniref:adenylosuccinate lyase n=1 Tax=Patiriisocius sp. TaxID=2822396 RepID=UPI003EF23CFD